MKKLFASDKVYVGRSKISDAGRGVFARFDIKKGEIVETCPIIELPKEDRSNLKDSLLVTYFLYFGKNRKRLAIILGFGSIYNHSYKPNVKFSIFQKENVVKFVALKNIKKDDELTFNYYNCGKFKNSKTPLWFEV